MSTSHLVIGGYQATQRQAQVVNLVPWIVGAAVVVVALFIISKLKK